MSRINFPCQNPNQQCSRIFDVSDEHVGRSANCPVCEFRNTVPSAEATPIPLDPSFCSRFDDIFVAAKNGTVEDVRYFVEQKGVSVKTKNNHGDTPLHWATGKNSNLEVVKYLISQDADIDAKSVEGVTPLFSAAGGNSSAEVLEYLISISRGADVNAKDGGGITLLQYASGINPGMDILCYLVSHGADISLRNSGGMTALDMANTEDKKRILRGAAVIQRGMPPSRNIFRAAEKGTVEDVKNFVEKKGVDVNAKEDGDGLTPLHHAAWDQFNVAVLQYLISKGADVNARTKDGVTPLHFSASNSNVEILKCLISNGADVNAKNNKGITPLHWAAESNANVVEVLEYLISEGADVNAKNGLFGKTPLGVANTENKKRVLREAMGKSSQPQAVPKPKPITSPVNSFLLKLMEYPPLAPSYQPHSKDIYEAIKDSKFEDVRYFVEKGGVDVHADSHSKFIRSEDIMYSLFEEDEKEDDKVHAGSHSWLLRLAVDHRAEVVILHYLASLGCDVNAGDGYGKTALHCAANLGTYVGIRALESLDYLIFQGGNVNAKDSDGRTPLDLAEHGVVRQTLIEAGGKKNASQANEASWEDTMRKLRAISEQYSYLLE